MPFFSAEIQLSIILHGFYLMEINVATRTNHLGMQEVLRNNGNFAVLSHCKHVCLAIFSGDTLPFNALPVEARTPCCRTSTRDNAFCQSIRSMGPPIVLSNFSGSAYNFKYIQMRNKVQLMCQRSPITIYIKSETKVKTTEGILACKSVMVFNI